MHWYYDPPGNSGKSTLVGYLIRNRDGVLLSTKAADNAYMSPERAGTEARRVLTQADAHGQFLQQSSPSSVSRN